MTERRRFLATASGVMAAAATAAIVDAPNVIAQPKVQWRMSTAWTPAFDILQGAAQRLGKIVEEMSGGRFHIEVFPGGQIMQPSRSSRPARLTRRFGGFVSGSWRQRVTAGRAA